MKASVSALSVLLCLLAIDEAAFGQAPAPNDPLASAVATAQQRYNRSFVGHPQLYSGPEYVDYAQRYHARTGHQFFLAPERQPGGVYYNDHYFPNVRLSYDLVLDQVVLPQPTSPLMLRLINEQVRYFEVAGRRFVRLVTDSTAHGAIRTGYYELLVDNRVQVLAKRTKRLQEHINQRFVDVEFVAKDRLFIKKAGVYYPVTRKSAAVRLFADRSKEVQQFIQDKKLSFGKAQFEASVVQLALFYSGLPLQ